MKRRRATVDSSTVGPTPNTFGGVGEVDHGLGNGCSTASWDLINDAAEVAPTSFGDGAHGAPSRGGESQGNATTVEDRNAAPHQARIDKAVRHPGRSRWSDIESRGESVQVRGTRLEHNKHPKLRQGDTTHAGNRSRRNRDQGS